MNADDELKALQARIAELQAERAKLEALKAMKMEKINLQLKKLGLDITNIPRRFSTSHPILTAIAEKTAGTGREAGRVGLEVAKDIAATLGPVASYIIENRKEALKRGAIDNAIERARQLGNKRLEATLVSQRAKMFGRRRKKQLVMI